MYPIQINGRSMERIQIMPERQNQHTQVYKNTKAQYRHFTYNVILRRFVQPLLLWKSNEYYTNDVCICGPLISSMQCACAILSSVVCPTLQYFSTLSHKRHDFRKKIIESKICILTFSTTIVWNTIHSKKN